MRQAVMDSVRARRVQTPAQSGAIPAPVGGWDAISPLAAMPRQNAVQLDNFVPKPGYVEARRGYQPYTTGISAPVQTLIAYNGGATNSLFAISNGSLYAATSGAVGAALVSGLNSSRWQYVNFSNAAGIYALAFSGADTPLKYDGSSWTTNSITGVTSSTLENAVVHKRRVFMSERNTLSIWYLAIEAISGAASELDLGPVFSLGGSIACMGTWTVDGGAGPDDNLVVVTTMGQVAVYQGTDPADASNWALVGVYTLGAPLGVRSLLQYGAELVLLTVNGVIPLSQAAAYDRSQDVNVALTAKIQNAFAQAVSNYGDNFGWEGFLYPNAQLAIYNVPIAALGSSYQYVQNLQTGAWARFKGINAFCWAYSNGLAYFGGSDGVYQWDTSSTDNGSPITCDLTTAYWNFGASRTKQFTMMRPILRTTKGTRPAVDIVTDYRTGIPINIPEPAEDSTGMIWGSMVWGSMVWANTGTQLAWTSTTGVGYTGAVRLRAILDPVVDTAEVTLQVIGFDVLYESGAFV